MPAILKCEQRFVDILKKVKGDPIDIRMYVGRKHLSVKISIKRSIICFVKVTQVVLRT